MSGPSEGGATQHDMGPENVREEDTADTNEGEDPIVERVSTTAAEQEEEDESSGDCDMEVDETSDGEHVPSRGEGANATATISGTACGDVEIVQGEEEEGEPSPADKRILCVAPERFRCVLCRKLFKAEKFVIKHLNNRHAQVIRAETGQGSIRVKKWKVGEILEGARISLRPKTVLLAGKGQHHSLMLLAASTAVDNAIVAKADVLAFIKEHLLAGRSFVVHNITFTFHVIENMLASDEDAQQAWLDAVSENRLSDTMILHSLVRLATQDEHPQDHPFEKAVDEVLSDKDADITPQHLDVDDALKDDELALHSACEAILLFRLHAQLHAKGLKIHNVEEIREQSMPDCVSKFGLFTEGIQVGAALALHSITKRGIRVDEQQVNNIQDILKQKEEAAQTDLPVEFKSFFELPHGESASRKELATRKSSLEKILGDIIKEMEELTGRRVSYPRTPDGSMSLLHHDWRHFMNSHPFVKAWCETERARFLAKFVASLPEDIIGDRVHPSYTVMVRNGRTSCGTPNLQHIPRDGGFRECFIPSPGHVFLKCDYSFIELCTLAAVCKHRYGYSILGNVISKGADPHSYTAAVFDNMSEEDFSALKHSENEDDVRKFKRQRHRAKAINFGIAGGQGLGSLRKMALEYFDVFLTYKEAKWLRKKLITMVYPELGNYLYENIASFLAFNLQTDLDTLWTEYMAVMKTESKFDPKIEGNMRDVLCGLRRDGMQFHESIVSAVWDVVRKVNNNKDLDKLLEGVEKPLVAMPDEEASKLMNALFGVPTATLTGRLRYNLPFTKALNTPFSGLAADGAKIALWNLHREKYKVVAFIHDEVIVEIPETADFDQEMANVEKIMVESMMRVSNGIPIKCSSSIANRWE